MYTTNSVTITQPDSALSITGTSTSATCANNDGAITVHAAGSYGNYTYNINDGAYTNSAVFTGLAAGTYKMMAKDGAGCVVKKSIAVKPPKTACALPLTGASDSPTSGTAEMHAGLKVKVLPNPAQVEFNLQIISGDSKHIVEIRVMDMNGKVVYHTQGGIFDTYKFGRTFAGGMYVAEVLNGVNIQRIKLVKGN